jgi:hypothetical protein
MDQATGIGQSVSWAEEMRWSHVQTNRNEPLRVIRNHNLNLSSLLTLTNELP